MIRTFDDRPATREKTPILVGLVGPSGSGKTFSALRLAAGFQRVTGGETFVIDTEARRALHYAELFKFRHVAFGQPFSPLEYLAAIEHCVNRGATTIIVDSMSHEHEGPGGVLEMHAAEHARLGGSEKVKLLAWNKPKSARRRLINSIMQLNCNFIFCFRAKQKLKIDPGKEPQKMGFQPISGEEFIYEMTLKCLLLPGANGVPTWQSDFFGEKAMIKLPEQFRQTFATTPPPQLTEDIGETLARWGAGAKPATTTKPGPGVMDVHAVTTATTSAPSTSIEATKPPPTGGANAVIIGVLDDLTKGYRACSDPATFRRLQEERALVWKSFSAAEKKALKEIVDAASDRVDAASRIITPPPPHDDDPSPPHDVDRDAVYEPDIAEQREIEAREREDASHA